MQIVEVDLAKLFADSAAGKMKSADAYQRVCGTTLAEIGAGGDMALDGDEDWAYFRVGRKRRPGIYHRMQRSKRILGRETWAPDLRGSLRWTFAPVR